MVQALQGLIGIFIVACVGFMLLYWTNGGHFVAPVVAAFKKGRDLARRRRDLS